MWILQDVKMGLKNKLIYSGLQKQETERFFQMKRKMKYLALYALPDVLEAEEDLEICLHDLTQDETQKILIAKLWVRKYLTKTQSIQLNLKLKTGDL